MSVFSVDESISLPEVCRGSYSTCLLHLQVKTMRALNSRVLAWPEVINVFLLLCYIQNLLNNEFKNVGRTDEPRFSFIPLEF